MSTSRAGADTLCGFEAARKATILAWLPLPPTGFAVDPHNGGWRLLRMPPHPKRGGELRLHSHAGAGERHSIPSQN